MALTADHQFVEITHSSGLKAKVLTYGATLADLWVPDAKGNLADILIGHDGIEDWLASDFYAGATCGRYANRIAGAQFPLDGKIIKLTPNEGDNQLHGGPNNFAHQPWTIQDQGQDFVTLSLTSPDGSMGFPATIRAFVTYRFDKLGRFWIKMRALCDAPTVLNMANHAYFNLTGQSGGAILDHQVQIFASHYTPVRPDMIPTGEIRSIQGSPYDFRHLRPIGLNMPHEKGFDQNLCLTEPLTMDWGLALRRCARALDPVSGRGFEMRTNQPGVQFYTGGHLHGAVAGKGGSKILPFAGFALETQLFPDSPNHPQFPSARLSADQEYLHITAFDFTPQA